MRVLITPIIAALAGCYSPGIDDCQFKCGPRQDCPDGTECRDGFCRTDPSAIACPAAGGCPAQPAGCDPPVMIGDATCATLCSQTRSPTEATQACGGGPGGSPWRIGVLDTAAKLDALGTTTGRYWTGGFRSNSTWRWGFSGPSIAAECWAPGNPGVGDDCAFVDGAQQRLSNNANCSDKLSYVCTTQ